MLCIGSYKALTTVTVCFSIVSSSSFLRALIRYLLSWIYFFADSGHGGQTKDLDGDEVDGMDEGKHLLKIGDCLLTCCEQ